MDIQEIVVAGTITPDGTLELDQKPNLAPGRVTVVLRQDVEAAPASAQEDWWQYLQRIRAEREAAGYPFMNEEEMNSYMAWLRDDDYSDEILRQLDEKYRQWSLRNGQLEPS